MAMLHVGGRCSGKSFRHDSSRPEGNVEAFEENTFAFDIFGDTVIFDNTHHATRLFGVTYQAATYGAETADGTSFIFVGRMTGYVAGIAAGFVTVSVTAEFDEENPDVASGTFAFETKVTLCDIPEANLDSEFDFVGYRVEE